jgi:hypothetical protein
MMRIIVCVCALFSVSINAHALIKNIKELTGKNQFIEVAVNEMNQIKFPYDIKEVKSSKKFKSIIEKDSMFITPAQDEPVELYVVFANKDTSPLHVILIPKSIPSTVIEIIDPDKKSEAVVQAERSLPYEVAIRNMIVAAKKTGNIDGYYSKTFDKPEYRRTNQLLLQKTKEISGYKYRLEVWSVRNISLSQLYLKEDDFYVQGMRAISLDDHELKQNETTTLYIVQPVIGG